MDFFLDLPKTYYTKHWLDHTWRLFEGNKTFLDYIQNKDRKDLIESCIMNGYINPCGSINKGLSHKYNGCMFFWFQVIYSTID